jgi:hypothetical protein
MYTYPASTVKSLVAMTILARALIEAIPRHFSELLRLTALSGLPLLDPMSRLVADAACAEL